MLTVDDTFRDTVGEQSGAGGGAKVGCGLHFPRGLRCKGDLQDESVGTVKGENDEFSCVR